MSRIVFIVDGLSFHLIGFVWWLWLYLILDVLYNMRWKMVKSGALMITLFYGIVETWKLNAEHKMLRLILSAGLFSADCFLCCKAFHKIFSPQNPPLSCLKDSHWSIWSRPVLLWFIPETLLNTFYLYLLERKFQSL